MGRKTDATLTYLQDIVSAMDVEFLYVKESYYRPVWEHAPQGAISSMLADQLARTAMKRDLALISKTQTRTERVKDVVTVEVWAAAIPKCDLSDI